MADEEENENSAARQRTKALAVTDPRSYETPVSVSPVSRALFDALSMGGSTAELADLMIEATEDPEILDYVRGVQGLPSSKVRVRPERAPVGWREAFTDIGINDLLTALPFPVGIYAYMADRAMDDDQGKIARQEIEEIQKQLAGFERLTEDQKLEMTEELAYPGDFDMIIDLYDVGNVLGQKMPLFYGNLSLTERGLFAETPSYKTLTAEQIKKANPDWDDQRVNDLLTPPFDSSAGRALGAMTARYASIMVPISAQRAQSMGYAQDAIGEMERVDYQLLAPGEDTPAGLEAWGPEAEVQIEEGEFVFGIDDALAYYEALQPEQKREFAMSLLALGFMDDQSAQGVQWLIDPDQVFTDDAVRLALTKAAADYGAELKDVFGVSDPTNLEETGIEGEARGKFIPMLGRPGGMFDTEEAQIEDFESFIRQARITAGYLASVPTESITQTVNDWSWRNLGRAADPSLIRMGLNLATQINENPSNLKPGGIRFGELAAGVESGLRAGASEEELKFHQGNVLNRVLTAYLARG
mgnify:CR=1 FL=1|tara:strand:+ start:8025 stop:9611 length:1587 start_codon:yes stop_codon:yes gene_type:complete